MVLANVAENDVRLHAERFGWPAMKDTAILQRNVN